MSICSIQEKIFENEKIQLEAALLKAASNNEPEYLIQAIKEKYLKKINFQRAGYLKKDDILFILNEIKTSVFEGYDESEMKNIQQNVELVQNNFDELIATKSESAVNEAKIDLNLSSNFINLFGSELNNETREQLTNKLKMLTIWNIDKRKVIGSLEELNKSILTYKNDLYKILQKEISIDQEVLYNLMGKVINSDRYENVLQTAYSKIVSELKIRGTDKILTKEDRLYNATLALYILNNFDNVIEDLVGDVIKINPLRKNKIDLDLEKYNFNSKIFPTQDWVGSIQSKGSDNYTNNIFDAFISSIPNGNGGYISSNDLKRIFIQINVKAQSNAIISKRFPDKRWGDLLLSSDDILEQWNMLIDYLLIDEDLKVGIGNDVVTNLTVGLRSFREDYIKAWDQSKNENQKTYLNNYLNMGAAFMQGLFSNNPTSIALITPDGVEFQQLDLMTRSKQYIYDLIKETIIRNVLSGNTSYYRSNFQYDDINVPGTSKNIFDSSFIRYMQQAWGVSFTPEIIKIFSSNDFALKNLFEFIDKTSKFVNGLKASNLSKANWEIDLRNQVNTFIDASKFDSDTIGFTGVLVSQDDNSNKKLLSQNLDALPSSTIQNIAQSFVQNLDRFRKSKKNSQNIFVKYPGLFRRSNKQVEKYSQHVSYRYDIKFREKSKTVVKASELNSDETAHTAFNFEFIKNILDNKIFSNQSVCYSDKVTIPLVNINVYGEIEKGKRYIKNSNLDLEKIYKSQYRDYFIQMEEKLINTYNVLFNTNFSSLDDAIFQLNQLNSDSLRELIKLNGNNLQLIDNVHYSINKQGNVFFNPELFGMIQIAKDPNLMNQWLKSQSDELNNDFKTVRIAPFFKDNNFLEKNKEDLYDLFEIKNDDEWNQLKEDLKSKTNWSEIKKSNVIFRKYFLMGAISTEAEIQMTGKYPFIYGGYTNFDILGESGTIDMNKLFQYHSKSYATGSKRNSLHTASKISFGQGLPYGVPAKMKIAVVEDHNVEFTTYLGQSKKQDVHDGGGETNGIFSIFENNSFEGKTLSGTKKEIGFTITYEGITQTKYADYVLSNSLLRNSKGSVTRLKQVFKSMNNVPFKSGIDFSNTLPSKPFYKEIGGLKYQIVGIAGPNENGQYTLNLKTSEGQEFTQNYTIKTVYDLWEALGGEWTWEIDQNGYKPSESSMEYVAYIISELQPELKSEIIAKIIPKSATKSAAININKSLSNIDQDPKTGILLLRTYDADTNNWGIQNDSSHLADESEISGPTQVIQALSFYGTNIKLASDVYKSMAAITMESLRKLDKQFTDNNQRFNFHYQLAQDLLISLQAAKDVSSAPEIAKNTIEALEKWKQSDSETRGEIPCLPYDSPEIFPKISSDLVSALNKTSIKTKFSGIAVVLNPSHGMVTLYEDIDGKIHTTQDLLRKSKDYFSKEVVTDESKINTSNWTPDQYISEYLKSGMFSKLEFDIMDIQIGDHIVVKENNTEKSELIDSPTKLRNLVTRVVNGAKILEIQLYKGRDLRPSLISYNRAGQKFNFWHHEAVRLLEEDRINKVVDDDHKLYFRAVLTALSEGYDYTSYDDWVAKIKIPIDNLNYKPGEQMLPKVNKTIHSLGNKTLMEVEEGSIEQFESNIRKKLQPSNFVTSRYGDGNNYIQLVKSDSEIIITNNSELEGLQDAKVTVYNNEKWIVDSKGDLLCKSPDGINKYVEKIANNGKRQYIIVNDDLSSNNINDVIYSIDEVNSYFYSEVIENSLAYVDNHNKILKSGTKITSNTINFTEWTKIAQELYTSFQLSNKTTSLRIPSQSLQSFMAMQTVAFMDTDYNDGYVNIYEILFQGSDFDIDKAYTVMYDLDNIGRVESFSNLFDYSSEDALYKSTYMLPLPDKSLIINNNNQGEDFVNFLIKNNFGNKVNLFKKIEPIYFIENGQKIINWSQEEIIQLLELMKESGKTFFHTELNQDSSLIVELNKHNQKSSTKGYRNKIVSSIFKVSNDIVNLEHASQLMESKEFRDIADEIRSEDGEKYSMLNPMSRFKIQEKNSVGKTNIGIFANGTKSNSVGQQYFNEEFQKVIKNPSYLISERYKINIDLSFTIPGKTEPIVKYINRLGNTVINEDILRQLHPGETDEYYAKELKRISLEPEVADKLSMLISLATDNAKELLLDRINAIPELSNMHVALFTLGFSVREVLEISMNLFDPLAKALRVNRFHEVKKKESIRSLILRTYKGDINLESLLKIQDVGEEMTLISKVLKINQGVPSKYIEVMDFLQKLNQSKYELEERISQVSIIDENKFLGNPLDILSFVNDENYRNKFIQYMDQFKMALNIFDVIANTPHFFAMLQAVVNRTNKLEAVSGKAKFLNINNLSKEQFISLLNPENSETESESSLTFTPSDNRTYQTNMIDHKVIGSYLSTLKDYIFNLGDVNNQLGRELATDYSPYNQFDLSTEAGISLFISAVQDVIIPNLKQGNLKSNAFLEHLVLKANHALGTTNYDIDVDFFGVKTRQLENTKKEIENGFKNIANKNSGLKNIHGRQIKLGEIFYLYNLICYKQRLGGLTRVVKNVDNLLKTNLKLNLDIRYRSFGLNPENEWGQLTELVKAASDKSKMIEIPNRGILDLNNKYIYTFNKPILSGISVEKFMEILTNQGLEYDINCI